jgi:hypothetical protein
MALSRFAAVFAVGLPFTLAVGCSDPYAGRHAISGKVTLEGQPLEQGMIRFEPMDGQGTTAGSAIMNGAYNVERKDGLKPGKYVVKITSGDGVTPTNSEEDATNPGGTNIVSADRIPPEYNERSTQQIEVTEGGNNTFDFAIPKAREIKKGRR